MAKTFKTLLIIFLSILALLFVILQNNQSGRENVQNQPQISSGVVEYRNIK